MLGKLSIIGAVAAILMMPTALSAQVGGQWDMGAVLGRDGGTDESMSPQFGIRRLPFLIHMNDTR
jgi:hypothetical protein